MSADDPRVELLADATQRDARSTVARLVKRLNSAHVLIRADEASGTLALSLANLTARFVPTVEVEGNGATESVLFGRGGLRDVAAALVDAIAPAPRTTNPQQLIIVDVRATPEPADLYATADAWSLRLGTSPVAALASTVPGPAHVMASALAAAEVFRRLLPEVPAVRIGNEFTWNLLDYRLVPATHVLPRTAIRATCFGAGSVGSSLVYTLLLSGTAGVLDVVDNDSLVQRNRLRYPLWTTGIPRKKVAWIQDVSRGSSLLVHARDETVRMYVDGLRHPPELAVAAVDSAPARRDVAEALALTTLNAGVDGLRLHVSRHGFADGYACVYCPYVDLGESRDQEGVLSDLTGLPSGRIRRLLGGELLSAEDVANMRRHGKVAGEQRDLVGARLADVVRDRLYAQAPVPASGARVAVAAPFVSAAAGAILAAEVLKAGVDPSAALDRRVDLDCSGIPTGFTSRPGPDPSGRCVCYSAYRRAAYRDAWQRTTPARARCGRQRGAESEVRKGTEHPT